MIVSSATRVPAPSPPTPKADAGEVFVTGDGFVQNFGPVVAANGTLRLYESGAAVLLAKDIVLKDGIHIHGDAVKNVVTVEGPDGRKIDFKDSEVKLPYAEKSDHAVFEVRSHRDGSPCGFVEDVWANGDWKVTHYSYADGSRQEQELNWKSAPLEQRWAELQRYADLSNAQA